MSGRLIGLLAFYDEAADWLTAAIASHSKCGMTDIVVCDGAYELFPNGRARSGVEQHRAITSTCDALGIGLTLHTPRTVWTGNEVQKRSFMFQLGLTVTDGPQDWFMVIDADHLVTDPDPELRKLLAATDLHCAEFGFWQRPDPTTPEARQFRMPRTHQQKLRLAYRANPGLRCLENHYTYVDDAGRILWGQSDSEPALDLSHIRIEHRTTERDMARKDDQNAYYRRRETTQAECGPIHRCDWQGCDQEPEATVPFDFQPVDGSEALMAGGIKVCAKHLKRAHYENRARLAKLGIDYGREGELLKKHT
jgi:hypothetical protein